MVYVQAGAVDDATGDEAAEYHIVCNDHLRDPVRPVVRRDRCTNYLKVVVMKISPIKTQGDYRNVLKEIEGLMIAKRNTPEGDRLTCWSRWWRRGSAGFIQWISRTR